MHYSLIVVLPPGDIDLTECDLADALAPFDENSGDYDEATEAYTDGIDRWWDWWQLGGRWTGFFDDYNPHEDPTLRETCSICSGTGTRDWSNTGASAEWIAEMKGCNGCHGTGQQVLWPTQWPTRRGDITTPSQALTKVSTDEGTPFRIIAGETMEVSEIYHRDKDYPDCFEKVEDYPERVRRILSMAHPESRVVIVDYHC